MKKPRQNNYAFIDAQNLFLGVKSQGWEVDFVKLRVLLQDMYSVSKLFIFIGYIPGNERLYTKLQEAGFVCIFKPTISVKNRKGVKIKGNVDTELVLHAMIEINNYSQAVIVTGDGDFYCLIEYLDTQRKLRKIIVPNQRHSSLLRKFSGYIANIQLFKNKVIKKSDIP